ncbi:MAG: hypothetical protein HOG49_43390 [Candidatus Scalindua sp.]|jgi:hypothetical protein|nr:hypothetical protein [Candidatus Scalindua sp.]
MSSWLSKALGTNSLKQKFKYDPSQSTYDPNENLTGSVGDLNNLGNYAVQQGKELFSGNSPFLQSARDNLSRSVGDQTGSDISGANRLLASRGAGGGGISTALSAILKNKSGETLRQGQANILAQGMQAGQNMLGLGGSLFSQSGQLSSGMDARALQNNQFNTANKNEATQFDIMGRYNQAAGNRANRAGFTNSLLSAAGGALTGGLSTAFSAASGAVKHAFSGPNTGAIGASGGGTPLPLNQSGYDPFSIA